MRNQITTPAEKIIAIDFLKRYGRHSVYYNAREQLFCSDDEKRQTWFIRSPQGHVISGTWNEIGKTVINALNINMIYDVPIMKIHSALKFSYLINVMWIFSAPKTVWNYCYHLQNRPELK